MAELKAASHKDVCKLNCRDRRPRLSEKTKIGYAESKEITPTDFKVCRGILYKEQNISVAKFVLISNWPL